MYQFFYKTMFFSFLSVVISACSPNKTSDDYIQTATAYINQDKYVEAIIELKNAARLELNNAEVRMLLGKAYVKTSQAASAEKELKKALELGADKNKVVPSLLKALNMLGKNDEIVTTVATYQDIDLELKPEVLLYATLANIRLGNKTKAKEDMTVANEISADSAFSRLSKAYLSVDSANFDEAMLLVNNIIKENKTFAEAYLLKGQLHISKDQYIKAINAFNFYFELSPDDNQVRVFLANAYVRNHQFKQANVHLDFILGMNPEHAFSHQLKSVIHFKNGKFKLAFFHSEKAINNGISNTANKMIAGLSAYQLKNYQSSLHYLSNIKHLLPNDHQAKKVLAQLQIIVGKNDEAMITLTELDSLTSEDAALFASASFKLLQEGKKNQAKELLSKSTELTLDNAEDMIRFGILKLSLDDVGGIIDLENAITTDPNSVIAKKALASAYLNNNEFNKAIVIATKWIKDEPNNVEGYNLAAQLYLHENMTEEAEQLLHKALDVNAGNIASLLYFSNKYYSLNQYDKALTEVNKVLENNPDNITALVHHYRINKELNDSSTSIEKIKQSFDRNTLNMNYRLAYAKVLFADENYLAVTNLLKPSDEINQSTPSYFWLLKAESFKKLNKPRKVLLALDSWIKYQPEQQIAWLKKISVQERLKDYAGALNTVANASHIFKGNSDLSLLFIYFNIKENQLEIAQDAIDTLSEEQKIHAFVKGMQGELWFKEGAFEKALPNLKDLYQVQPSGKNVALVYQSLSSLKKDKQALSFLEEHVENYPSDGISRMKLAELTLPLDIISAKNHYLYLLKETPQNGTLLNNLAWVEYELGNYKAAEEFINKSLIILPSHPQVLDTAALIYLELGMKDKAIKLLEKANSLAPNDKEIMKHLISTKDLQ